MVIVLVGVALITGCILAYVNHATEGPIAEQKEKTLADGIKTVMGGGELTVAKTDTVRQNDEKGKEMVFVIYGTEDAQKNYLGAAVESTTGGFGGDLKVLVGFDPKGTILGYTILEHAETPGLGAKATSRAFLKAVNQAYKAYQALPIDGESGASKQTKKEGGEQ